MIYGIIDVGSNTIRLNIYKFENREFTSLLQKKTMAGLAGYVEEGKMNEKGIKVACEIMSEYQNILHDFGIHHIYVFATASLRNINNTEEVVRYIKEKTGITVDVVSGEEEARLDFKGATNNMEVSSGILIDIGGGSTEIVTYENGQILQAVSMPIGSLSLFTKHVSKLLPKRSEREAIVEEVETELQKLSNMSNKSYSIVCGVGGTIRATKKLHKELFVHSDFNQMDTNDIASILTILQKRDKNTLRKILRVVPDRVHTIIPGMLILDTIIRYFGSEVIFISNYGVREGYLYSKVLGEE